MSDASFPVEGQSPESSAEQFGKSRAGTQEPWSRLRLTVVLSLRPLLFPILVADVVGTIIAVVHSNFGLGVAEGAFGLIICFVGSYLANWAWTGIGPYSETQRKAEDIQPGKTLWDVLQLIVVPFALAIVVWWLNERQSVADKVKADQQAAVNTAINQSRTEDGILDTYVSQVSDLILNHDLPVTRNAGVEYRAPAKAHLRVVTIARARTLVAVRRLDPSRQSTLVRFLIEAGLTREISLSVLPLEGDHLTGVDLAGADMQWANLSTADLRWTNLRGADLRNAHLEGAHLQFAHLQRASLQGARLAGAHMRGATLEGANLTGADLQGAQLVGADLKNAQLQGAKLAGADLQGARLDGARLVGKTSTKRTQLPAVFTAANLTGVSWRGTWCPDGTRSAISTGGCAHHLSH